MWNDMNEPTEKKGKKTKQKYEDMSKEEKIKLRTQTLKRQFAKLDKKSKQTVDALINNAAFMTVTLEYLQEDIKTNGVVTEYQNGENQWGTKKSPEVEIYNTMIKNLSSITKQLCDMLPKDVVIQDDGFDDFIKERD